MSANSTRQLEAHYAAVETELPVRQNHDYAGLVVANGNSTAPFHRWFHFKEAFSSRLLQRVIKDAALDGERDLRVLDPYGGSGTTAVSVGATVADGGLDRATVYALESNPFLHLVGATKLRAMQAPPAGFVRFARRIAAAVAKGDISTPTPPSLSTFHHPEHFDANELSSLLCLREAIRLAAEDGADPLEVDLAFVALGSIVERVSALRRDGRALRRVNKQVKAGAIQSFLDLAHRIGEDLPSMGVAVSGRVLLGDGRLLEGIDRRFSPFDLALFSPPYPNNIDYTEVYKLENWLLGLITTSEGFADQRGRTVYSHPSLLRPDPLPSADLTAGQNRAVEDIVRPVLNAVPSDRYEHARTRMLRGYVLDMFLTLRSCHSVLRPGGRSVYVVGNSVHGRSPDEFVVAADLLMARCAEEVGFSVERFEVARELRRRTSKSSYLRESVVFLRKVK